MINHQSGKTEGEGALRSNTLHIPKEDVRIPKAISPSPSTLIPGHLPPTLASVGFIAPEASEVSPTQA